MRGYYRRYTEDELRINGLILKRRGFSQFQLWVFDRMVWFWKWLDPKLPRNPVSIIAVGVKPTPSL